MELRSRVGRFQLENNVQEFACHVTFSYIYYDKLFDNCKWTGLYKQGSGKGLDWDPIFTGETEEHHETSQ